MFWLESSCGQMAITNPTTVTIKNKAGRSRRARPAQNRRRRMVPVPPHSFTNSDVMRKPESTKKASTP